MRSARCAVAVSLPVLWSLLAASPSVAADNLAECSRWSAAALTGYARAADLEFNRDPHGKPILYALTMAAWLMQQDRWGDAAYWLIGFDRPFWLIPGRGGEKVPGVVGKITTVLHHCSISLGPDYSMRPMPSQDRQTPFIGRG